MNTKQIFGMVFSLLGIGYFIYGLMYKNILFLPLILGVVGIIMIATETKSKK